MPKSQNFPLSTKKSLHLVPKCIKYVWEMRSLRIVVLQFSVYTKSRREGMSQESQTVFPHATHFAVRMMLSLPLDFRHLAFFFIHWFYCFLGLLSMQISDKANLLSRCKNGLQSQPFLQVAHRKNLDDKEKDEKKCIFINVRALKRGANSKQTFYDWSAKRLI